MGSSFQVRLMGTKLDDESRSSLSSESSVRAPLVQGNREREMESHSISPSFLCLDKFYKNMNEIKSNYGENKLGF